MIAIHAAILKQAVYLWSLRVNAASATCRAMPSLP